MVGGTIIIGGMGYWWKQRTKGIRIRQVLKAELEQLKRTVQDFRATNPGLIMYLAPPIDLKENVNSLGLLTEREIKKLATLSRKVKTLRLLIREPYERVDREEKKNIVSAEDTELEEALSSILDGMLQDTNEAQEELDKNLSRGFWASIYSFVKRWL